MRNRTSHEGECDRENHRGAVNGAHLSKVRVDGNIFATLQVRACCLRMSIGAASGQSSIIHLPVQRLSIFRGSAAAILFFFACHGLAYGATDHARPLSGYSERLWQTRDGLPDQAIQAFAQTPDGHLWIGTAAGLVKFDGAEFTVYTHENAPGLIENGVNCLLAARDGSLWIGTEGGGVIRYRNHVFRPYPTQAGFANNFVRTLFQDSRGTVWVGSDQGLFKVEGNHLERVDATDGVPSIYVRAIAEDKEGNLWVGGTALLKFSGRSVHEYFLPGGVNRNLMYTMHESRDGTLWAGTLSGLYRIRESGAMEPVEGITSTVDSIAESYEGALWVGTIGQGAFVYKRGSLIVLPAPEALPSNTVYAVFSDNEGNLWLGTRSGMLRFSETPVGIVRLPGSADSAFETIYLDRDRSAWVAASTHLFRIQRNVARLWVFPRMKGIRIRTLLRDKAGTLWIGTDGAGVIHLTGTRAIRFTIKNGLCNDFVRAILQDRDGNMWIGTDGGVSHIGATSIVNYGIENGLVYYDVTSLTEANNGDMWIGTSRGLSHLHAGSYVHDLATKALRQEKIWSIYQAADGGLWIGTSNGLFRFKSGKLTHLTSSQGLVKNVIYSILQNSSGDFWLGSPDGISLVNGRDLNTAADGPSQRLPRTRYFNSYDMDSAELYSGMQPSGGISTRGEAWFPSNKGAVHILPTQPVFTGPPPVAINRIVADGQNVSSDHVVTLAPGNSRLEVSFGVILLRSQEAVRYRYKLENFEAWSGAPTTRTAYYTNLPPGRYKFLVQAFELSDPGAASEAEIEIVQRPHFYRTASFISGCIGLVLLLIFAIYRFRIYQVKMRFRAVLEERARLSREMHDTLIQGCTGAFSLLEALSTLGEEKTEPNRALLDSARDQISATIEEARQAIWDLRHGQASKLGIEGSLMKMAEQIGREFSISIGSRISGRAFAVDQQVAHEVLMVAREALYNAARHSGASRISLHIAFTKGKIEVCVRDNGTGFEMEQHSQLLEDKHYGLNVMRERINTLGGEFHMESKALSGTELRFTIPTRGRIVAGNAAL